MSLRRKTLLIVDLTLIGMMATLYISLRPLLLGSSAGLFLPTVLIAALAFGIVTLNVILGRVILAPVARLSAEVAGIGQRSELAARAPVTGGDELGQLAEATNAMLAALEQAEDERQRARVELQETEELLRSVVECIPIGILGVDREYRVRVWNTGQEKLTGVPREEILGRDIFERFPSLKEAGLERVYDQVTASGEPVEFTDHVFYDPNLVRSRVRLNIRANPLKDAQGEVAGIVLAVEDISDLKRSQMLEGVAYRIAEAAGKGGSLESLLGYMRQELGTILDTRNYYIALYDPEKELLSFPYYVDETFPEPGYDHTGTREFGRGLTEYVMRAGEALLASGSDITALAGKDEIEIIGDVPAVWLGAPLKSEDRTVGVIAVQNYTDANAYTADDLRLLRFVSGQIGALIERKRAEEALARSHDFYLTLFDEFPALIRRSDTNGQCDYCNRSWLEFTGRTKEQEAGDGWQAGVHADDIDGLLQTSQKAVAVRRPFELEYRLRRHDGQHRWILEVGRPFNDVDGSFAGYLGSCFDVTDRKRLEEQFRQSQKMEAIGRLAGGVAHDFNNLLTAITGYASFVRDTLPAGNAAREDIDQILKAAERAGNLTRQLLAFSRRQMIAPSVVNLNEIIINMSKMLRRLISEDIELVTIPASHLGAVKVDPGQIEQVLANLVVNAGDSMPEGGRLTIETANVTLDAEYARQHVAVIPGDYVMLAVSDTGCGMTEEVKSRVFEPFFTTKEPGKGTGLGLATCYGIVKQHGGHIYFYSEPSKGTTFKAYFPRVAPQGGEAARAEGEAQPVSPLQTVLLVEDDASVRTFAARVLRETGYTVLEATNGPEALNLAAQHADAPIHLLVTDVVMPHMGGEELASRLKASHPELKALFVSGYTAHAIVGNGGLDQKAAFLQKPFTLATLTRKVREVLENQP